MLRLQMSADSFPLMFRDRRLDVIRVHVLLSVSDALVSGTWLPYRDVYATGTLLKLTAARPVARLRRSR